MITYDQWEEQFRPIQKSTQRGDGWHQYREDPYDAWRIRYQHLWSMINVDGRMSLVRGIRFVNLVGWCETEVPWTALPAEVEEITCREEVAQ